MSHTPLRCPLKCAHCLAAGTVMADMPLDDARELIDQVARMGVPEFLITGGEPLAREDLAEVIAHLQRRQVRYSLNTACMPDDRARAAMEAYPPGFVAVSVDGPESVHDRFRGRAGAFREAMEAVSYFSRLPGCEVAAGTTVTQANFSALAETFHLVAESAADRWGLHLLVPEGRAAQRKDLFLSRKQLKQLLSFVARRRNYFPVTMADEFGYCGDVEPLVRDVPFRCGAGRAQCVVLPDGSVTPCTTLDRSTSAGNIHERPLEQIWADGFGELRQRRPAARCRACEYAQACEGGCWLQQRKGTVCYKEMWHVPGVLATAGGVAICLGMLAGMASAQDGGGIPAPGIAPPPPGAGAGAGAGAVGGVAPPFGRIAGVANDLPDLKGEVGAGMEACIVQWYGESLTPVATGLAPEPTGVNEKDPGYEFFTKMRSGKLPKDLPGLSGAVGKAMQSQDHSLALAALAWRSLAEWCLNNPAPKRTAEERKMLRDTMSNLETQANDWRKGIFNNRLDPYLARGRKHQRYQFMATKGGQPRGGPLPKWWALARDTAEERWGRAAGSDAEQAKELDEWLQRHPYADHMQLQLHGLEPDKRLGIFDFFSTDKEAVKVRIAWSGAAGAPKYEVTVPAGCDLSYVDLLQLAYQQNRPALERELARNSGGTGPDPLLMPTIQQELAEIEAAPPPNAVPNESLQRRVTLQSMLADFWMF